MAGLVVSGTQVSPLGPPPPPGHGRSEEGALGRAASRGQTGAPCPTSGAASAAAGEAGLREHRQERGQKGKTLESPGPLQPQRSVTRGPPADLSVRWSGHLSNPRYFSSPQKVVISFIIRGKKRNVLICMSLHQCSCKIEIVEFSFSSSRRRR